MNSVYTCDEIDKSSMATPAKKQKKEQKKCRVLEKWFEEEKYAGIISKTHPQNTLYSLYCLICDKSVPVEHQGKADLDRHCDSKKHVDLLNSKRAQKSIKQHFVAVGSEVDKLVSAAEVKVTGFLAEHNLPLATADHLGPLFRNIFPDSKIAKAYACGKTKASCILNRAIAPDLQETLVNQMKTSCFSIATDGSNDQGLEKMNPVTVRIFDINQHKVVTKFLDMCKSRESNAKAIFRAIDTAMSKYGVSWDKCVSLGVDNTSVNVGRHNSVIVEARKKNEDIILMGCPCHIAHNAAKKATDVFSKINGFDIDELLVDVYFHFDYSSKRKNLFAEFCDFCDQDYRKILKFHSVRWLGMATCIERVIKLFPSLKSYCLSLKPDEKGGKEIATRNNRLIAAFKHPLAEVLLKFLHAALPPLIHLNLLLQRSDPLIHILYDALFTCAKQLLSRFASPELVRKFDNGDVTINDIKGEVFKEENILDSSKMFVGFLLRTKLNELLNEGDISERDFDSFYSSVLEFHRTAFIYAIDNFPLQDEFLQHARFLIFYDQKCTFESVLFVAEKLKSYINFSEQDLSQLEEEFLFLQSITLDDMSEEALKEAAIRYDDEGQAVVYRIDVLWYHLSIQKIQGTNRSKFHNLFKLVQVVLCIIHSNAEEESVFSRVKKNLTPQRASLELDGTLSSILSFQLNRPVGEKCFQYKPSEKVVTRSKKVTREYNQEHSSVNKSTR